MIACLDIATIGEAGKWMRHERARHSTQAILRQRSWCLNIKAVAHGTSRYGFYRVQFPSNWSPDCSNDAG